MNKLPPARLATTILNALKGGVVPRVGLEYITVGRKLEIDALLRDIETITDGGATFRFIVGKYGCGKSFLLQTIRNYAMDKNFVVVDADLSPERRLQGTKGQGLATYKELIKNMATKTSPDGGALSLIIQKWIANVQTRVIEKLGVSISPKIINEEVEKEIYLVINSLQTMVNGFDFAKAIVTYWKAYQNSDDLKRAQVLKWLRGEYTTKSEAKSELGIGSIITDDNWYDYLKLFSQFLVKANNNGLLVLIDEIVNIYKIPNSITRQYNYEKILTMYNDVLQGKGKNIGIIMCGTPQSIEDTRRGIFSYEALKSRLSEGKFANENYVDMLSPIIRIEALTPDELIVLVDKLADIHANFYKYERKLIQDDLIHFIKTELGRIGADTHITPREIIRDFIEILNILFQNSQKSLSQVIGSNSFAFSQSSLSDEDINKEFEDFEV